MAPKWGAQLGQHNGSSLVENQTFSGRPRYFERWDIVQFSSYSEGSRPSIGPMRIRVLPQAASARLPSVSASWGSIGDANQNQETKCLTQHKTDRLVDAHVRHLNFQHPSCRKRLSNLEGFSWTGYDILRLKCECGHGLKDTYDKPLYQ